MYIMCHNHKHVTTHLALEQHDSIIDAKFLFLSQDYSKWCFRCSQQ